MIFRAVIVAGVLLLGWSQQSSQAQDSSFGQVASSTPSITDLPIPPASDGEAYVAEKASLLKALSKKPIQKNKKAVVKKAQNGKDSPAKGLKKAVKKTKNSKMKATKS